MNMIQIFIFMLMFLNNIILGMENENNDIGGDHLSNSENIVYLSDDYNEADEQNEIINEIIDEEQQLNENFDIDTGSDFFNLAEEEIDASIENMQQGIADVQLLDENDTDDWMTPAQHQSPTTQESNFGMTPEHNKN